MNTALLLPVTALYTGLFLLLILVLAANVVRQRLGGQVSLGDGGNRTLAQAIRAHGNATEYVPVVLIGLAVLELTGAPGAALHLYGGIFFLGRLLHAIGMTRPRAVNKARQLGIALSWLIMLAMAIHLIGCKVLGLS
ncbi:MAPEG family protein [Isoalcanivorax indicus]|uniref:MAPEG family protein n=1 Tax=Isoalcanivorax indicus TaxID=2202653 RepID=UPI000DBA7A5D|nr:MAPEG family protein [Isoalcanivorax indicus]